jgi:endonuclease/exonuclease/phosphatase family metal-dependent hydrolase
MASVQARWRTMARHHPYLTGRRRPWAHVSIELLEDRCLLSSASPLPIDNPHDVRIMSRNLYIGADFGPVLVAGQTGNPLAIAGAIGEFWKDVQLRDFPARAEAVADEIAEQQPALIGLQEVSQFTAGNVYYPNGVAIPDSGRTIDYLDILLDALDDRGLHYTTVATTSGFGGLFTGLMDAATFALQDIQYADRDVVLARTDLPAPAMLLSNVQGGNYATSVPVQVAGVELAIKRSWNSVDVQMWGQDFRFVNAHLEDDNPAFPAFGMVQVAQAYELIGAGGPTDTDVPVILVGDFNSRADGSGTATYQILTSVAGLTDSWNVTHPGEPGYTWGQNDDLRGEPVVADPPPPGARERIDLLLYRGEHLRAQGMQRVMEPVTPSDPATGPRWPSDHAGVAATIALHVSATGQEQPWMIVNDDPLHPGEQALFIVGTDGRDQIRIDQYASGRIAATMADNSSVFLPTAGGHIYVHAADGNDRVSLTARVNHDAMIFAGLGDDTVYGGSGDDEIRGGDGRDSLFGEAGHDTLDGGAGADRLLGGLGNDWLLGGTGNDLLFGGAGHDKLFGESGNDWLFGEAGDDELDGGDGYDWLFGGPGRNVSRRGERVF